MDLTDEEVDVLICKRSFYALSKWKDIVVTENKM